MTIRIAHAADLHIGARFDTLPPDLAANMRESRFRLLEELIEKAEALKLDAILFAGDLFDRPQPDREDVSRAAAILNGTAIKVFISPGNHDFYGPRSPYTAKQWGDNVHIFTTERPERVACDGFDVYGAAFCTETVTRPLLTGFAAGGAGPAFGCIHGELNPSAPRYNPVSPSDIASSGLKYLALGHVHKRSDVLEAGGTTYAFSGSMGGAGFDETGVKGFLLVEYDSAVKTEFVPLSAPVYYETEVDLTGFADPAAAVQLALPADSRNGLFKFRLTGTCEDGQVDFAALSAAIAPLVTFAKFIDDTHPPLKLWDAVGEDSLKGLFLDALKAGMKGGDPEKTALIEAAAEFGLAALDGREIKI